MFEGFAAGLNRRDFLLGSLATSGAGALCVASSRANAQTSVPNAPPSVAPARQAVNAVEDAILRISREVWANPELSLAEVQSSQIHMRELRSAGFAILSTGTSGTPTAFVAEWSQGSGGPKVGFLPEYDALPGLGNAAEPRKRPGPNGAEVGHGCGHNMLGAGCTGAAMALKRMMLDSGSPGTIRVYGSAAEETQGVNVFMARDGLFNDLDACLAWHPASVAGTGALRTAAADMVRISFRGRSAHAGVAPWEGRSALKAAEMFGIGIQFMREHVLPTARLHYVYTSAGQTPNVVPDKAEVLLTIRDENRPNVIAMTEWASQIAAAAAMTTQTEVQFSKFFGMWDLLPNDTLIDHVHRHMTAVGLRFTDEEQAFAKACQREFGVPQSGMATTILPVLGELKSGGSTPVGDVSYNTPMGIFAWPTMPIGIGLHTWPVTACGGMSIGEKASLDSASIMAGVGYDLMTDVGLRGRARSDFERRKAGTVYSSPLPPDRLRPDGIPSFLLVKEGQDELVFPISGTK